MNFSCRIASTVCASIVALHITSAYAEVYLDEAGVGSPTPPETEIKQKTKDDTNASSKQNHPVAFFQRTTKLVSGASSNQEVFFSAKKIKGNIEISFKLHGKEFLFTYNSISIQKKNLRSFQLILNGSKINEKTQEDDDVLSTLFEKLQEDINQLDPLENGILSSLDFLINMVPRNEPFDKIDLQGAKQSSPI